ncbi:matrilin-2-like isoform X2 [Montipora capricornis]|uniref:matrilin-2-like isoform X2 n=1 Tax=Montipora capricornis TaxID=246305 RepID=UPI0035F1344B
MTPRLKRLSPAPDMKFLFIFIALILQTWHIQGQNQFATCNRAWTKIGCFKDKVKPSRPLPEMLLNDRDRFSKYHQPGYRLNWNKWSQSQHSLACRCAEKALQKGYRVFGLQFYGECWSGPFAEFNYSRDGNSDNCIMNLQAPTACVKDDPKECVGQKNTNYIYMLTANPGPQSPDVDGGFTEWSDWSECSKTCGGGTKSRERECTNPTPQGNGRPCEGDTEETTQCNMQKCLECVKKMDVAIVVDTSSSVKRVNFEVVKTFIEKLVEQMPISSRMSHVAIVSYNHRAYKNWDFLSNNAQYLPSLQEAVSKLNYRPGGTRTDRGMSKASELFSPDEGARRDVPHVLIVITDGKTSPKSKPYSEVLKPLKEKNVKIIAVGVGPMVDKNELTKIAYGNSKNVLHVDKFDDLNTRIDDITAKYCVAKKPVDINDLMSNY